MPKAQNVEHWRKSIFDEENNRNRCSPKIFITLIIPITCPFKWFLFFIIINNYDFNFKFKTIIINDDFKTTLSKFKFKIKIIIINYDLKKKKKEEVEFGAIGTHYDKYFKHKPKLRIISFKKILLWPETPIGSQVLGYFFRF